MIPYCISHGIGVIPWGPLHAGDLARPIGQESARSEAFKNTPWENPHSEEDKVIIERVDELAKKKGWKNGQVALAWIKTKITSPIVGVSAVRFDGPPLTLPTYSFIYCIAGASGPSNHYRQGID